MKTSQDLEVLINLSTIGSESILRNQISLENLKELNSNCIRAKHKCKAQWHHMYYLDQPTNVTHHLQNVIHFSFVVSRILLQPKHYYENRIIISAFSYIILSEILYHSESFDIKKSLDSWKVFRYCKKAIINLYLVNTIHNFHDIDEMLGFVFNWLIYVWLVKVLKREVPIFFLILNGMLMLIVTEYVLVNWCSLVTKIKDVFL